MGRIVTPAPIVVPDWVKQRDAERAAAQESFGAALTEASAAANAGSSGDLLSSLSDGARGVLAALKNGEQITKGDWVYMMRELRDAGAITDKEYLSAGVELRLVPIGEEVDGKMVLYSSGASGGVSHVGDSVSWRHGDEWDDGDPLKILDDWILYLTKTRAMTAVQRREDTGEPLFQLNGLDSFISACDHVSQVVKGLIAKV